MAGVIFRSKTGERPRAFDAAREFHRGEYHSFNRVIGPFYDIEGVAKLLPVDLSTVRSMATERKLIMCLTRDSYAVFPTRQFDKYGRVIPGLRGLLQALEAGTGNEWTHALWIFSPNADLDGISAVEWISSGGDIEVACQLARKDAARWSR